MSRAILGFASMQELAAHLGRSPFAVARRLKSLRRAGVEVTIEALGVSCPSGRPRVSMLDAPIGGDPIAQQAIAEHPDGLSLGEIAELYGVSHELVRQIERAALARLAAEVKRRCGELPYLYERSAA